MTIWVSLWRTVAASYEKNTLQGIFTISALFPYLGFVLHVLQRFSLLLVDVEELPLLLLDGVEVTFDLAPSYNCSGEMHGNLEEIVIYG